MITTDGRHTKHVDSTNIFHQAEIQEEVYIKLPQEFGGADKLPKILKLLKSLYGLKQTPKTFFDKPKTTLLERAFVQSESTNACSRKRIQFA